MARIIWTPPEGWVEETGARLSFRAPCDCVAADALVIGENTYTFLSAMGTQVSALGDAFVSGALVEAVLDCENGTAYIVNADGTTGLKAWKAETETALDDMEARIAGAEERLGDIDSLEARMDDFDLAIAALEITADDLSATVASHTEWQGMMSETVTDLQQKADDAEARFETITTWQNGTDQAIADLEQTASDQGASIGLLVEYNAEGKPVAKGSVLIEAINGESTATIDADRVNIGGALIVEKLNALAEEAEDVGTLVKISADLVDIEGKVTADYIEALGITAASVKVNDTDGSTIFDAGGNACTIGGSIVATANGLVAPTALEPSKTFRASMGYTSSSKTLKVSNYGSSSASVWYNNVYDFPSTSRFVMISGWVVNDELFFIHKDDVPTGNKSGIAVLAYHKFAEGDPAVFEFENPSQASDLCLIVNHPDSAGCNVVTSRLRFSEEGLLGGGAADGSEIGGYLKIAPDETGLNVAIELGLGAGDECTFYADGSGVYTAHLLDLEGITLPEVSVRDVSVSNDANNSAYVKCYTLADLIDIINRNFDAFGI